MEGGAYKRLKKDIHDEAFPFLLTILNLIGQSPNFTKV